MTESLEEKMERLVWGKDTPTNDVFASARALVVEEMKYRIYPGLIWDLRSRAESKAEEHANTTKRINEIIRAVDKNVKDDSSKEHSVSLQTLSAHHAAIAQRYKHVASACSDHYC